MIYRIQAKRRAKYLGFRRAGIFFPSESITEVNSDAIGERAMAAILAEPMLVCEVADEGPQQPEPAPSEAEAVSERRLRGKGLKKGK